MCYNLLFWKYSIYFGGKAPSLIKELKGTCFLLEDMHGPEYAEFITNANFMLQPVKRSQYPR